MVRYWIFTPWVADGVDYKAWADSCSLLNAADVYVARQAHGTTWSEFPIARLAIMMDEPLPDCFSQEGYTFVSSHLRNAMSLDDGVAQFFDVDSRTSTTSAQEKDYKILNVAVLEGAIDAESSALTIGRLAPGSPEIVLDHGLLAFLPSFNPQHEMFADRLVRGYTFCNDALAARVLQANCTGVRFFDAARFSFANGPKNPYRTLRGVEQDVWDFDADKPATKLLEGF